jgi:hypothetical protein
VHLFWLRSTTLDLQQAHSYLTRVHISRQDFLCGHQTFLENTVHFYNHNVAVFSSQKRRKLALPRVWLVILPVPGNSLPLDLCSRDLDVRQVQPDQLIGQEMRIPD